MKRLLILLLTTTSLLTACQMSDSAAPHPLTGDGSDSSAFYQKMAYEEMFNGSLTKAEATSVVTPCPSVTRRWRQMPMSGVFIAVGRLRG
jgi:hypothetical protein